MAFDVPADEIVNINYQQPSEEIKQEELHDLAISDCSPYESEEEGYGEASIYRSSEQPPWNNPIPGCGKIGRITINAGEDIVSKLRISFRGKRQWFCIVFATGVLSKATLRGEAMGKSISYDGRFNIVSLSGSYMPSEDGFSFSWSGFTVLFEHLNGHTKGGVVDGPLIAASPVELSVLGFTA